MIEEMRVAVLAGSGRRRVTMVAAVGAAVALAGCGGQAWSSSAFGTSPTQAVLDSVRTTTAARTARIAMTMTMTGLPEPGGSGAGGISMGVSGAIDLRSQDAQLRMTVSGYGASDFGGVELRLVDHVSYVRFPSVAGVPGAYAGKWLRIDVRGLGGGVLDPFGQTGDAGAFLGSLAAVSGGVQEVGTDTVRGVSTTHYRAVLDLAGILHGERVPAALRPQLRAMASQLGVTTMPVDVWVDAQGYLRRMTTTLDESAMSARLGDRAGHPTMTMTMDLYDFGTPVHVVPPPSNEIVRLPVPLPGTSS